VPWGVDKCRFEAASVPKLCQELATEGASSNRGDQNTGTPRRPKVDLVVDDASFRAALNRPEAKEPLDRLIGLIVDAFIETLPDDLLPWLQTAEGQKALGESWPQVVDGYFKGLCKDPPRKKP
jgi:hypothetical protein